MASHSVNLEEIRCGQDARAPKINQTALMSKVDELLESIRKKPGMYLGTPSFSGLQHFLAGYSTALVQHDITFEHVGIWRESSRELLRFHDWVCKRLGFGMSSPSRGYPKAILEYSHGDEVAALALFWLLLDEYRALEQSIDSPILPA